MYCGSAAVRRPITCGKAAKTPKAAFNKTLFPYIFKLFTFYKFNAALFKKMFALYKFNAALFKKMFAFYKINAALFKKLFAFYKFNAALFKKKLALYKFNIALFKINIANILFYYPTICGEIAAYISDIACCAAIPATICLNTRPRSS